MIPPVPPAQAGEKLAQTYARVNEMLGTTEIPAAFQTLGAAPIFAHDFYMNFKKFVWSAGHLDEKTKATIALGAAAILRSGPWIEFLSERCKVLGLSEQHVIDTIGVAATCQMYNVFFKFRDVSGSDLFGGMGVGLRAHTFAGTSLYEKLVELLNTAISDMNSCKPCTSQHVVRCRELGWSNEAILEAIQCAATLSAACVFTSAASA